MNVDAASPVRLSSVVPGRLHLRSAGSNVFEIREASSERLLGTIRQAPDSANRVEAYDGKGGFTMILTSPSGLRYFALPGSKISVGGTTIELPGEPLRAQSDRPARVVQPHRVQGYTRQAMILGAGLATRFEPISGENTGYSKPAVPLAGERSVIECIANALARDGLTRLIVNTYFMPESMKASLARSHAEIISYIDEAEPSGTAGGLRKMLTDPACQHLLDTGRPLLVVQGDAVTDADFSALIEAHVRQNALVTLGCQLVPEEDVSKFGIIVTDRSGNDGESGRITAFQEKPAREAARSRMANTGFYIFSPRAYPLIADIYAGLLARKQAEAREAELPEPSETLFDFAMDIFPELLRRVEADPGLGAFWAQVVDGYWSDIGNPMQYAQSVHDVYAGRVALDPPADPAGHYRDGVIYWGNAQRRADQEGAALSGNVVVVEPFQPAR